MTRRTATKRAPRKKPAAKVAADAKPIVVEAFEHDYTFLRAAHCDGRSPSEKANGFRWPLEAGVVVEAPDWDPNPERSCGGGLHGLADGLGDWGLLPAPSSHDFVWFVCGARRDETVASEGKIRCRRCRVLYVGTFAGAMQQVAPALSAAILRLVEERQAAAKTATGSRATGPRGAASATGEQGAASATGEQGAASATGPQGAASATGPQGAASATGKHGVALAAGIESRGLVAESCLLVLVERDPNTGAILHYFAAIAGERGIEAGKWYELKDGKPVEVGS